MERLRKTTKLFSQEARYYLDIQTGHLLNTIPERYWDNIWGHATTDRKSKYVLCLIHADGCTDIRD
jgi:hypothetical protein